MAHRARFNDLELEGQTLRTPAGEMPLAKLVRAEFVRELGDPVHAPSTTETSVEAVAGGAVVGGVLFGTAGAVVGGVLGSTVKDEVPGAVTHGSNEVHLEFATDELSYRLDVERDQEMEAFRFVGKVQKALKELE